VLCSAEVVALAGVEVRPAASEEDMAEFRDFLDDLDPEDFKGD
jgi:hypothetical protein